MENQDRISELPNFILHHILSFMSKKEAARTSLLKKIWRHKFCTSPNVHFDENNFSKWLLACPIANFNSNNYECMQWFRKEYLRSPAKINNARKMFYDFVTNFLSRYQNLDLSIEQIIIKTLVLDPQTSELLDEWLRVAIEKAVKNIDLSVSFPVRFSTATLPKSLFESPKNVVTSLRISKIQLPEKTFKSNDIIFPLLKTLHLDDVYIEDGMLQELLMSPTLEILSIKDAFGFQNVSVSNSSIKIIRISLNQSQERINVNIQNAASLTFFTYLGSCVDHCYLKMGNASILRCLNLKKINLNDGQMENLIAELQELEHLYIESCNRLKRLCISSSSLKTLCFFSCNDIEELRIDAPSLVKFQCSTACMFSLSINDTTEELITQIHVANDGLDEPSWLQNLEDLL